jgi:MFS family permease
MHRRVEFLLFGAGWGANHFSTLLVVYRKELGLSPASLGILFGAYAIGLVPGLVAAGRASDAWGRRAVVLPASALAIVASTVLAFGSRGFAVLFAGRLLYGIAMGSMMSPGSVWVQELSSAAEGPRRATLALSAGFGLGPLVSGVVAEFAPAPMVLPYAGHVAVMALALLGTRSVPETAARRTARRAASSDATPRGAGRTAVDVLARQLPVAPWAFGLPAITMAVIPGLLRPIVARPVVYSALVIVVTLASGMAVQPLTTRIRRGADLCGLAMGATGVLVSVAVIELPSPLLAFAAAILVGAGYGLVMTTGLREVSQRVPPEQRGTAVGVYYVLTYLGFAVPFVHATVARQRGDGATLVFTFFAVLICLGIRALVAPRAR